MKSIQEILEKSLKNIGMEKISHLSFLQSHWKKIVGDGISKNSSPIRLNKKQLTVWVRSSSWSTELSMMKLAIIKKISDTDGAPKLEDIRFVLK